VFLDQYPPCTRALAPEDIAQIVAVAIIAQSDKLTAAARPAAQLFAVTWQAQRQRADRVDGRVDDQRARRAHPPGLFEQTERKTRLQPHLIQLHLPAHTERVAVRRQLLLLRRHLEEVALAF
jgi:hypothetical protein